ncbi:MAG: RDD family protein [Candidatus Rokubacteria bacterium]|nr:RDD family protein [Candidatus Rokubacteria bacterium]
MAQTCPKCGDARVETDECPRCRVIVSKYRDYLERLGQKPSLPPRPSLPEVGRPVAPSSGEMWPEGSPAGFWIRAAALVVDGLVLQAAFLPFQLLIVYPTLLAGGILQPPDPARVIAVNAGYSVVAFLVYVGYVVWMHGKWGQTLGKVATGVKVVKASGAPVGYGRSFGRWLATLLSVVTLGIGFLMAGLRSDKRALHDLVAGTRVMKVRRSWLDGRPSGFWMRYAALSLDMYVLALPVALFGILAAVAMPLMAVGGKLPPSAAAAVGLTVALFLVAFMVAYSVWMHGKWGQTLGKMALGMKVIRMDGSPLGYGGAFIRWMASVLSVVVLMIGYIMAGLRSDKRALHDLLAGTRVTYIR